MVLLAILSLGVVSADENATLDQDVQEDVLAPSLDGVEVAGPIETNNPSQLVEGEDYTVHISDLDYDMISTVEVAGMPWDASGNISISVDGKEQYNNEVYVSGNALILNDLNLAFENHSVLINYSGDGKYAGFVKNATINPYFYVSCTDDFYEWGSLDVHTSSNLPGNIKIVIDNKVVYNKRTPYRYVEIDLEEYSIGTHSYEVFYSGKSFKKGKFNHLKSLSFQVMTDDFIDDLPYDCPVRFSINIANNAKGFAKFKGKEYPFLYEEGADGDIYDIYVVVSGFDVGENVVEFHALNQVINYSVFVKPKIVVPTKIWINATHYLTFNASGDLNGDLVLSGLVNGTYKVNDGFVSVPISNLSLGKYPLKVKYENYNWEYNITVLDETPDIIFEYYYPSEVGIWDWLNNWEDTFHYQINLYGGNYSVTGTTRISEDGSINETYEGEFYTTWPPNWFDVGKHNITVSFEGDSNFKPFNRTIEYEVIDHTVYIDYDGVFVRLPGDAAGTLTVYVNGNNFKSVKLKGNDEFYKSISIPFTGMKKNENYVVDVVFKANNDKYSFNHTENFTVNLPLDDIGDAYIEWNGYYDTYDFVLPKDIKNKPVVKIDGKTYECSYWEDEEGYYDHWFSVYIRDLKPGNHSIVVSYDGDDKYPSNSSNATIMVTAKIRGPDDYDFNYGDKFGVYLNLPKDAVGNLSVEVKYDGESDYKLFDVTPIKDGNAAIDLPSNRVGHYMVNVYFKGNYEVKNYTTGIDIRPDVSYLTIKYGDQGKITVSMDNMSDSRLVLRLDEDYGENTTIAEFDLSESNVVTINKEIVDRAKSMMLIEQKNAIEEGHAPYMYLYTSIYKKDAKFNYLRTIKVTFASKITGLSNINTQYSAGKTLTLKVYDIFGKLVKSGETVKITIGKKTFSAKTNKNGVAKFKIPNTITPGKYTIKAVYKDFKVSKKLTIKQILTLKTVKVKKSAKKLVLTATLKKVNGKYVKGKRVTFKFNGKTYKAKTNKKGVAKVTIKKSVLKKLKVGKKVKYQATYLKVTVKKTAKVKK